MAYSYGLTDERFKGKYKTEDEAIKAGFDENPDYDEIWIAARINVNAKKYVDGIYIIESVVNNAADYCGEACEGWLDSLYRDKKKISELEKLIGDWIQEQEPPKFFEVENLRKIERERVAVK